MDLKYGHLPAREAAQLRTIDPTPSDATLTTEDVHNMSAEELTNVVDLIEASPQAQHLLAAQDTTTVNRWHQDHGGNRLLTRADIEARLLAEPTEEKSIFDQAREHWAPHLFSDPSVHNPEQFTYIVHSLLGAHTNPEKIASRMKNFESELQEGWFSGSLIWEDNTTLYEPFLSRVALILDVPQENIIAASPKDMQIHRFQKDEGQTPEEFMHSIQNEVGIKHPQEIKAVSKDWSEIIMAVNSKAGGKVKVKGIAIATLKDWEPGRPILESPDPEQQEILDRFVENVYAAAKELQWPVVVLQSDLKDYFGHF